MAQLCWMTEHDKYKHGNIDWQKESVITKLSIILRENEIQVTDIWDINRPQNSTLTADWRPPEHQESGKKGEGNK